MWLDLDSAADRARVTRSTINRWIASGRLPAVTVLGRRFVKAQNLLLVERERRLSRSRPGPRLPVKRS
ncbi:helix-turn-helix domain-containing protein [Microbispora bryophytorum]|uniref:helix-turn-helix domain-containing protein n=1 Tax=Microbispora bryophytorum TaxID=1460882 RepID=UPI003409D9C8